MKLSKEILLEFAQTKEILEELATKAKTDIEWSNYATNFSGGARWSAPEVYKNKPTYLEKNQSALQKYKTAIEVLDNAITSRNISDTEIQTLADTQIPKLVQTANRLKPKV